jgi:hypothetical protein
MRTGRLLSLYYRNVAQTFALFDCSEPSANLPHRSGLGLRRSRTINWFSAKSVQRVRKLSLFAFADGVAFARMVNGTGKGVAAWQRLSFISI